MAASAAGRLIARARRPPPYVQIEPLLVAEVQVADRFPAAIDQLGQKDDKKQDKLSIRLGGIYALQRLMIDSPPDEPAVVQVLCAFVRTHAPLAAGPPRAVPPAPAAVRASLTVLGHRPNPSAHVLDLSNTCWASTTWTRQVRIWPGRT